MLLILVKNKCSQISPNNAEKMLEIAIAHHTPLTAKYFERIIEKGISKTKSLNSVMINAGKPLPEPWKEEIVMRIAPIKKYEMVTIRR